MNDCRPIRAELGVYAVGALADSERSAVDRHLGHCPDCELELAELTALMPYLAALPAQEAKHGPVRADDVVIDRLMRRVTAERRSIRRRQRVVVTTVLTVMAAAAVAAVLLIAGVGGFALTGEQETTSPAVLVATGAGAEGVRLEVALTSRAWGTAITIEVANVAPGQTCSLVAVTADGGRETAATWTVPRSGYRGEGPGRAVLRMDGAVGLTVAEIERLEVVLADGERLAALPLDAGT